MVNQSRNPSANVRPEVRFAVGLLACCISAVSALDATAQSLMPAPANRDLEEMAERAEAAAALNFDERFLSIANCTENSSSPCYDELEHLSENPNVQVYVPKGANSGNPLFVEYSGIAEVHLPNGVLLRGYFENGHPSREVTYSWSGSAYFHEEVAGELLNGPSIVASPDGRLVSGYLRNAEVWGYSKITLPNGAVSEEFRMNSEIEGLWVARSNTGIDVFGGSDSTRIISTSSQRGVVCVQDGCEQNEFFSTVEAFNHLASAFSQRQSVERLKIQETLGGIGYYSGDIDGLLGPRTLEALILFSVIRFDFIPMTASDAELVITTALEIEPENWYQVGQRRDGSFHSFTSYGSGFFFSSNGLVMTNRHVVERCRRLFVDGAYISNAAELVYLSNDLDIAVLSAGRPVSVYLPLSSDTPRLMERVFIAGHPFGGQVVETVNVTAGIISATRGLGNSRSEFQLDAAMQPGNSGGPILNEDGEVLGVATYQLDQQYALEQFGTLPENTNYAISSSAIRVYLEEELGIVFDTPSNTAPRHDLDVRLELSTVRVRCES